MSALVKHFTSDDPDCPINQFTGMRSAGWYWRDSTGNWSGPAPGGREEALDHALGEGEVRP